MKESQGKLENIYKVMTILKIWTINYTWQWQWKYISNFVEFQTKYQGKYNILKFVPRRKCIALNAHF